GNLAFNSTTGNLIFNPSSTGNVGIGTTSPVNKLQVEGNLHMDGNAIYFRSNATDKSDYLKWNSTADMMDMGGYNGVNLGHTNQGSGGAIVPVLTVNMNNVGIGTTTPQNPLEVKGTTHDLIKVSNTTGGGGNTACIAFTTYSGSGVGARVTGVDNGSAGAHLIFETNNTGTSNSTTTTERMRVTDAGNVGIGTTAPADKLEVAGDIRAQGYRCRSGISGAYGSNIFNFFWTGSQLQTWIDGVDLGVTSDRRLKDRINNMKSNAIDRVMALRPVDFYFKKIEGTIFTGSPVQQEGFIADELQGVIPSAVNGEKDALTKDGKIQPQTLNVMPVVSVLTKAVQEQQKQIETQQQLIEKLQQRLDVLEKK
ncbi:MAG: hypothetical protein JWO06_3193, partial [Bacteroidota bacterium]|nr:hypothetical protein [Bacteroidota bacterium]